MKTAVFKIWRGDANGGNFAEYTTEISEGMVVLDASPRHSSQASQRSCLPMELQSRQMRFLFSRNQWHAKADVHDATGRATDRQAGHYRADEGFSRACAIWRPTFRGIFA